MTVTVRQLSDGIAAYIDREMIPRISGLRKWGLGLAGGYAASIVESWIGQNRKMLSDIGIMTEDGMVNIDDLASRMKKTAAEYGPVTEHLPLIGDATFDASDIDKLHTYIIS